MSRLHATNGRSSSRRKLDPRSRDGRLHRIRFEVLEPRTLLAQVNWVTTSSGNWNDGSNWSTDQVPGPGDDVVIDVNGASPTVTVSGNESIHSLIALDPLVLSSGIVSVAADSTISGSLAIDGGTVEVDGGTTQINGGPVSSSGTGTTFKVAQGAVVDLTGEENPVTYWGTYTGSGGGTIALRGGELAVGGANATFNFPTGMFQWTGGAIGLSDNTFTNAGFLTLSNSNQFDYLLPIGYYDGGTLVNAGTITEQGALGLALYIDAALDNEAGATYLFTGNGSLSQAFTVWGDGASLTNAGTIEKTGGAGNSQIALQFVDTGTIDVYSGTLVAPNSSVDLGGSDVLAVAPTSELTITGNLLGQTTNADQFSEQGEVLLDGSGTSTKPQEVEVMGQDFGNVAAGFENNFAYGMLALGNNTYVQLVDDAKNSAGSGAEALYVNALVVPAGCTLNLNGLHVYARVTQITGTIIGGAVNQPPSGGPISLNAPTPGSLSKTGQVDDWTFYGQAGQTVAVVVNTGSKGSLTPFQPSLNYAQVQLLDPGGNVVASATNTQAGADVTLIGVQLPADGTYQVQVQAPPSQAGSTGYYVITAWNAPVHNNALNLDETVTGQLVTPYAVDHWNFSAVANEQVLFNLVNSSSSAIEFDLTGPNGYSAFTNLTASPGLITLPTSGNYVLTAHLAVGQPGAYAFSLNETTQTALTVGSPYQGTLAGSGQAQFFAVTIASPAALGIVLTDANTSDENEIYVSLGIAPTRDTYQYRYTSTGADQSLVLAGQPGTYYILVYNNLVRSPGSTYALLVQGGPFVLTGFTPGIVGNSQAATLLVSGVFPLAYESATAYQIQLVAPSGTTYPASPLYLSPISLGTGQTISGTLTMSATLPAGALPAGTYAVRVTDNLGDEQTLPGVLSVTAGGTGVLTTSIILPSAIGYHSPSTLYVQYTNIGSAPMTAPLLVFTATRGGQQGALLSLDPSLAGINHSDANVLPAGYSTTVQFLASGSVPGILEPGETATVPVYYCGWLRPQWGLSSEVFFSLGELDATNSQTIDWSSLEAGLEPGSINQAAWSAIFPTLTAQLGSTWGQYLQTLDNDAVYLAGIGEPTSDLSKLLSFEIEKANASYTAQTLTSVTADSLPAPGLDLSFVQSFQQSISGRYTEGILGYGWTINWDISAATMTNGDVVIKNDGVSLDFSLQPNGSFAPEAGDQGTTLTASGGAVQLVEPDGTIYQFNTNGTLNYVQDTHGNRITAGYNTSGQLFSLTDSNGEFLDLAYNAQGHLATLTDSNGQTETYGYDLTGQFLTSYTDAYGTTKYTYVTGQVAAQDNALAQIAYANGTQVDFGYDSQGRLVDQHSNGGAGGETIRYLNPGGYVTTDSNGNQTTIYFNLYGAAAETIDPLGNVTRSYYDSNLNLTKVIGPGGSTYTYTYDANGNLTSRTDALGLTTNFTYDAHNNLTSYTDAKGNTTGYGYNSANDLLSITYANGTRQTFTYNPLGEATQFLNARGQAIGYTYDAQGLVATEAFADGTSYSYAYDARGNLTSATDAQGKVTTFVYGDSSNPDLLTEVEYPDGTWLKFSYNVVGQRTQSMDQSAFTVNYAYDSLGRLSELTDGSGKLIVQYAYDAAGKLVQKDMGNGTRTVYTYDADGDVLSITNYAPNHKTVNSFDDYTYDPLGNVLTDTNQDGQWLYTYDADSQLVQAVFTANSSDPDGLTAQDLQYVYDAAGNRTSESVNGVMTTYVTNNVNEYTSSTTSGVTTSYQYDADGNLIAQSVGGSTATYAFNELDQLTAVNGPGVTASYAYDPLGNRVSQTVNGVAANFQIDPAGLGNVVATFGAAGTLTAHYTYGFGLVSQVSPTVIASYYDFNIVGSAVGITGTSGGYVNKYAYLPFGQTITIAAGASNPFTFVGRFGVQDDAAGLLGMRARTYDPTTGQFVSRDPFGLLGGDVNLQRYAGNNPTGAIDADGTAEISVSDITSLFGHGKTYIPRGYCGVQLSGSEAEALGLERKAYFDFDFENGPIVWFDPTYRSGKVYVEYTNYWIEYENGIGSEGQSYDIYLERGLAPPKGGEPCPCHCPPVQNPTPRGTAVLIAAIAGATSQDPNSMVGPAGYGTANFVSDTSLHPYQIVFENDPTATAPAQRVDITDQLDPNLNWSTLQLAAIGFGSTYTAVPAGLQHYDTSVNVTENGQTFEVLIDLNLNPATGIFSASLQSIDPGTDLPPASVLTGFLPPEDGTGRGIGFVSFTVSPKISLSTGTQIRNVANISFDFAPNIATDQVNDQDPSKGIDPNKQALVTIDATAPTSSVKPLPATTTSTSFTVSWSGSDGAGSGIASYNVFVSNNGGPFTPFLTGTTQTSATFTGQFDHTYGFYSVATSNVGNVQPTPTAAQATTYLAGLPTSTVNPLPATTSTASFTVSWNGSPGPGAARIASYEIFVSHDGGPFQPFLTSTTQTSTTFSGAFGQTYAFYSVATDNLGDRQPTPAVAQTTTTIPALVTMTTVRPVTNKKHLVTQISIGFSGAVNAGEADSPATYRLATAGKKGSFTAKNAQVIKLKSALYNAATNMVTLTPKKAFSLTKPVQLLVEGVPPSGLQDSFDRFIDGDHNGQPGGNAVAVLSHGRVSINAVVAGGGWREKTGTRGRIRRPSTSCWSERAQSRSNTPPAPSDACVTTRLRINGESNARSLCRRWLRFESNGNHRFSLGRNGRHPWTDSPLSLNQRRVLQGTSPLRAPVSSARAVVARARRKGGSGIDHREPNGKEQSTTDRTNDMDGSIRRRFKISTIE
ncbi:MAG: RHS repeat-associated core domain-containing protein [Isosphaerales bacterium]